MIILNESWVITALDFFLDQTWSNDGTMKCHSINHLNHLTNLILKKETSLPLIIVQWFFIGAWVGENRSRANAFRLHVLPYAPNMLQISPNRISIFSKIHAHSFQRYDTLAIRPWPLTCLPPSDYPTSLQPTRHLQSAAGSPCPCNTYPTYPCHFPHIPTISVCSYHITAAPIHETVCSMPKRNSCTGVHSTDPWRQMPRFAPWTRFLYCHSIFSQRFFGSSIILLIHSPPTSAAMMVEICWDTFHVQERNQKHLNRTLNWNLHRNLWNLLILIWSLYVVYLMFVFVYTCLLSLEVLGLFFVIFLCFVSASFHTRLSASRPRHSSSVRRRSRVASKANWGSRLQISERCLQKRSRYVTRFHKNSIS